MMKKLIAFAFLACLAGNAMADDNVSAKVSGTTLNIALTNSVEYVAFQMDVTLPSGVSATDFAAVATRLTQTGDDDVIGSGKFVVASNQIDATNNVYRVVAYNLNNDAIAGTSGANILNVTLDNAVSTASDVKLSNIIFVTKSDLAGVTLDDVTGENGYAMGDVNHDNSVDVFDIVGIIEIMNNPSSTLDKVLANVNGDSTIDVFDLVGVIEIINSK